MQLKEIIDKEGIELVSQKTNISVENLTSLNKQNFEKLNRVKALGFLNILKREYENIEIDGLREAIKGYYEDHKDPKDDEVIVIARTRKSESGSGSVILKWLIIGGVLYGAWHFYNTGKLNQFVSESKGEQNSLDDSTALKSNVSEASAKSVVIKSDANTTQIQIETVAKPTTESREPIEESAEKVVLTDTNATVTNINEMNQTGEENFNENPMFFSNSDDNGTLSHDHNRTGQAIENLTINPTRGMLWYGFINIDTQERREFMNKVSTPFELNGGRWILVTGHGYVDIVSDAKTIELADRIKHYFYIDSKEIREIERSEFTTLNNGRGW